MLEFPSMSTLLPDEFRAVKELPGKRLSAEQRKVVERMVGYAGLGDEERAKIVALDRATSEGSIFAVLREALHVLDHGGELAHECREKIEDWISGDVTSPLGQAARALLQAIATCQCHS